MTDRWQNCEVPESMESPSPKVCRETILKKKTSCPNCGRVVTLKYLASRHRCEKKRRGAPPSVPHKRRPKSEEELAAWAPKAEERAMNAFRKRQGQMDTSSSSAERSEMDCQS